jgi:hypothetical protein
MNTCGECQYYESTIKESNKIYAINYRYSSDDLGTCYGVPPTPMDNHCGVIYFERPQVHEKSKTCSLFLRII